MLLYIDHKFLTALGISSFKERYVRVHSLSLSGPARTRLIRVMTMWWWCCAYRKTVLLRIDTLKQEHGLQSTAELRGKVTSELTTPRSANVSAAAAATTEPIQSERLRQVQVITLRQPVKVSDEHDQQVGGEENNNNNATKRSDTYHRAQSVGDLSRLTGKPSLSASRACVWCPRLTVSLFSCPNQKDLRRRRLQRPGRRMWAHWAARRC
jgi:hypothetical protein